MPEQELRRAEPIDLLKQMDETVEQSMVQGTQPKTNVWGEIEEGQVPGKDILRPQEQKFYDHYDNERAKYHDELYGSDRDDRVLTYKFLDIMEKDGGELSYKNKIYANKLIELDNKLQDRLKTVTDKVRFDSKSRVPTQMDKYPKNLLTKEEVKELRSLKRKIQNTELYQDMEFDQRKLNNNSRRRKNERERELQGKEYKTIPKYESRYNFKVGMPFGNEPDRTLYEGKAPHWSDVESKYRKGYYSQLQKPKVGMMERIMHKLGGGDEALIK